MQRNTRGLPSPFLHILLGKALHFSLFLLMFVPPLFVIPGRYHGELVFVNYSEPKFAAVQVCAWLFLTIFWLNAAIRPELMERFRAIVSDRWVWLLIIFFAYLCLTAIKSLVVEASLYELFQYFTLIHLVSVFAVLFRDRIVRSWALASIALAFVVVVAIGYYQMVKPIPWLKPIRSGALFPSTMGYKNPAALSVTGQWFLLASLVYSAFEGRRWVWAALGSLLLIAEAGYIAALQSRTSYLAFTVGMFLLFVSFLWQGRKREWGWRKAGAVALAVFVAASLVFAAVLKAYPKAHGRLQMALKYIKSPSVFFNSDRGTYLRNSIVMANSRPLGVGVGNWAFAYPVMRKVNPNICFNKAVQVTRAHGDHAQMLGEAGWPGLLLWLALLGWLVARGAKGVMRGAAPVDIFITIQLCVFITIMLTDYCIQMPYHKFAFFTIVAFQLSCGSMIEKMGG